MFAFGKMSLQKYINIIETSKSEYTGKELSQQTKNSYIRCLKTMYDDLGNAIFDAQMVEDWITAKAENPSTRKQYICAIYMVGLNMKGKKRKMKVMKESVKDFNADARDPLYVEEKKVVKKALLTRFPDPYSDMLEKLIEGCKKVIEENSHLGTKQAARNVEIISYMLLAAPPMRSDYRNIKRRSKMRDVNEHVPYYDEETGIIYFPNGTRLKDENGKKFEGISTVDVSKYKDHIKNLLSFHNSEYLLLYHYTSTHFTRLMVNHTKPIFGEGLGIRFWRLKFNKEFSKSLDEIDKVLEVLGHNRETNKQHYTV